MFCLQSECAKVNTRRGRLPVQQKRKPDGGSARLPEAQTEDSGTSLIVLAEDRPRKIVHLSFSSSARRGSRTTTARLYAPPEAAGSRRDFMFTNFSKPGNDAPETSRPMSSCTESASASRHRDYPSPWRDAPRRAALRCLPRRIGKGRERRGRPSTRGDFIDRAIDGTRVSAVRLLSRRQRVGGKADGGMTKGTILRHDVASHQPISPEIARHEAVAAHFPLASSLPSELRSAANKFA